MDQYTATEEAYKKGYEQGKKDAVCLACKHAYFPLTEAYECKADLYVEEDKDAAD